MNGINHKAGVTFRRRLTQGAMFTFFRIAAVINGAALLVVVYFLVARGWRAINWTFLTQPPMDSMTKGGILPCIVGTLCLSVGAIVVALPIGVASAIYLNEYARPGRIVRIIRLGINNLAGVPSVVFGLFGLALLCGVSGHGRQHTCRISDPGRHDPAGNYRFY